MLLSFPVQNIYAGLHLQPLQWLEESFMSIETAIVLDSKAAFDES